ncbi:hypothetical protein ACFL6I_21315 [candidate division KSB1 bacterium]
MLYTVQSVNVFSIAKISFLFFTLLGIIFGSLYLIFSGEPSGLVDSIVPVLDISGTGKAVLTMLALAVTFGVVMAVVHGIFALLYNFTSGTIGGLRVTLRTENFIDTEHVTQIKPSPQKHTISSDTDIHDEQNQFS